ncbi:hypothetical protein EMIT0210MI2_80045 [Priestia megaterium]
MIACKIFKEPPQRTLKSKDSLVTGPSVITTFMRGTPSATLHVCEMSPQESLYFEVFF